MRTETATILPLPRRGDERVTPAARTDVRLVPTRRGRHVVTVLAFLLGLMVAAVVLLATDLPSAMAGTGPGQSTTVTVAPGDTLWGYAEQHAPEGMSEQEFITQVRHLNQLPTGRITAGTQIELPVAEGAAR